MDDAIGRRKQPSFARLWQQYRFHVLVYFAVLVLILFVYHFLSDGDFSFLMTLGSLLTLIAFGMLVAKVAIHKGTSGISIKSLQAFALVFAGRLCSILFYEGYLPFDKSGDWFYQACEVLALLMVLGILGVTAAGLVKRLPADVNADVLISGRGAAAAAAAASAGSDGKGRLAASPMDRFGVPIIGAACLLLAAILHPNLNGNWFTDVAWTFALYLEAVALFPQIAFFYKRKTHDTYATSFVFVFAVSRVLHFLFWMSSYHELNDKAADAVHKRYPGVMVILAQVVNLLLSGEYLWEYVKVARADAAAPLLPTSIRSL